MSEIKFIWKKKNLILVDKTLEYYNKYIPNDGNLYKSV